MKLWMLSGKLFLKKPFTAAVLALELAITALAVVIASNVYQYNRNCITILENSGSRLLYCSDPNAALSDEKDSIQEDKKFAQVLENLKKKYSFVKGYSHLYESALFFRKDFFERKEATLASDGAEILVYDAVTFNNIHFPLSKGSWPAAGLDHGKIPCILGGVNADRYQVGDMITGYTINPSNLDKLDAAPGFRVEGVLASPQQCLNVGGGGTVAEPASDFFEDETNRSLFLIVPGNVFQGGKTGSSGFTGTFVFLDRSCTQAQIDEIRNVMHRGYTQLDTEIVAAEQKQIGQMLETTMPFLIVLFLVVFLGMISVCMLATMKNMQTFKIYYLTGCPRRKILLMMLWYVLFYFVCSGILFTVFLLCLRKAAENQFLMLGAYFILQPSGLMGIGLVCAVVMAGSIVVPLVLLRKNDPAALLRKD